jgi:hypothetical protein
MRNCHYPQYSHLISAVFSPLESHHRPEPSLVKSHIFSTIWNVHRIVKLLYPIAASTIPHTTSSEPPSHQLAPEQQLSQAVTAIRHREPYQPTLSAARMHARPIGSHQAEKIFRVQGCPNKSICGPKHPANR